MLSSGFYRQLWALHYDRSQQLVDKVSTKHQIKLGACLPHCILAIMQDEPHLGLHHLGIQDKEQHSG